MAQLGNKTVALSTLLSGTAEDSFTAFQELVENSKSLEQSDSEKKISLLKYFVRIQQRMLRLNVIAKWCQQVPLIQYCQQLASTLSSHDMCFTQASDSLYFMHEGLQQAQAPIYDVPSAIEVFLTGGYNRLPKCIEDVVGQDSLSDDLQKPALKKLDILVRSKLLEISLPKEFSEVKICDGTALFRVDTEFQCLVTLGYRGHLSLWRILHMDLLVGEKGVRAKLEESQRHCLGDDLERRMAVAENPFVVLYSRLHELCIALSMDTVIKQVQSLRQDRWKDTIKFELTSDNSISQGSNTVLAQMNQDSEADWTGLRTPGVKIMYWLYMDKNTTFDTTLFPFLKIEPGPDLQIKCSHSTFIVDPHSGMEAELALDLSCIDVERLLLKALFCNRYTRLLEIHRDLSKNVQICKVEGDVILKRGMDQSDICSEKLKECTGVGRENERQEVLLVRAYNTSYFTLAINIRTGRFLLQSSKNVISFTVLLEYEEALSQGSINVVDVFINLRRKSILLLFASIGRFQGLEVYEHGQTVIKVPTNIYSGSDMLVTGFPDCGGSYFLVIYLDKSFNPIFNLLETSPNSIQKIPSCDRNSVTRWKRIDINPMQISEDGFNLSFLNCRSDIPSLCNFSGQSGTSESNFTTRLCSVVEDVPSSFSCIVDEVFGIGKSASSISLNNPPNFSAISVIPHSSNPGPPSSVWDSGVQLLSKISDSKLPSSSVYNHTNPLCLPNDPNTEIQSNHPGLFQSGTESKSSVKITCKSEQDLPSIRSPNYCDVISSKSAGDGRIGSLNNSKEPASAGVSFPSSSPPLYAIPDEPKARMSGHTSGYAQAQDPDICYNPRKDRRKRSAMDMLNLIPSLQRLDVDAESKKRLKTTVSPQIQIPSSHATKNVDASSCVYVSSFLHVLQHCLLCIKSAILTMQMQALGIAYIEEVGVQNASSNLWFRLPLSQGHAWSYLCLQFGAPRSMCWDVKIKDPYFRDIRDLEKGNSVTPCSSDVHIANISCIDSHISFDTDGVVLSYKSIESDSIQKLVADIHRLSCAKVFTISMRKILGVKEGKTDEVSISYDSKTIVTATDKVTSNMIDEKLHEHTRQTFRIEAVGLTSVWFNFGSTVLVRFVVEWESGKDGCTVHVSPDQIWPHTKFLEDFVNGGDVASLLDCISLTAGPLNALSGATRPARATAGAPISTIISAFAKQGGCTSSQGNLPSTVGQTGPIIVGNPVASMTTGSTGAHSFHGGTTPTATNRGGPGIVPSSLLPIDVSVVLRGPYWIRIVYRKHFAVDMRCFAGDQVWLQPATPPKVGPSSGGSLPCPQFRPFIMEHVAHELNILEPGLGNSQPGFGTMNHTNVNSSSGSQPTSHGNRGGLAGVSKTGSSVIGLSRIGNSISASPSLTTVSSGASLRRSPCLGSNLRGDLNTTIIGLGDDGGYGGGWVPLVALKKVLRGILKYLGVLWLFAQLPNILKEVLGSILKDNEGALLNLDQEQPALRFFIGGYVFAVSVHRVQLLLQILSVKRFQQQQVQQNPAAAQEELVQSEIGDICDYFCHRVASEPYDTSRVASFVTLLTLPISILREFLKLIAWKRGPAQSQSADLLSPHKPRVELCLENHMGFSREQKAEEAGGLPSSNTNIHYNRSRNSIDFGLTVVLDPALIPMVNSAGGAAWLPYCVSVRLRYQFNDTPKVSFLWMEGSHGGTSCWPLVEEWEKCKIWVAQAVEVCNSTASATEIVSQGRLRMVADSIQKTLHLFLKGLRDASGFSSAFTASPF